MVNNYITRECSLGCNGLCQASQCRDDHGLLPVHFPGGEQDRDEGRTDGSGQAGHWHFESRAQERQAQTDQQ